MKIIGAIGKSLLFIERTLIILLLSIMLLLAFTQVILRNFFSTGFLWADPLLRHMVLWIGLIGASVATHEEKHINLDIISRFSAPRFVPLIRIITNIFPALVCAFMTQAGWTFLLSEKETGQELFSVGTTSFPIWWFQIIIPAGFGLLTIRFLLKAIEYGIKAFFHSAETKPRADISKPRV